ncbi:hypothetical protein TNCV_998161 [Trichonephila clavipes]|nr:hypothetical protein TNCV_998161 [Trichonephila clavipes]
METWRNVGLRAKFASFLGTILAAILATCDYVGDDFWLVDNTTRGLLVMDLLIQNHVQVTKTHPELAPPYLTSTPHRRGLSLVRLNIHRAFLHGGSSDTRLELMTRRPRVPFDH